MAFDRDKFQKIAALLSSPGEGERNNAAGLCYAMLQANGMSWIDVLVDCSAAADREVRAANEVAEHLRALLIERDQRIAALERAQPDWVPVERVMIGSHTTTAKWLGQLADSHQIWLSPKERDFLKICAAWVGPLRSKQKPFLQSICDRVRKQYGLTPPP